MFEIESGRVNVGDVLACEYFYSGCSRYVCFAKVLKLYPPTNRYSKGRARLEFLKCTNNKEKVNNFYEIRKVVVPNDEGAGEKKFAIFKKNYDNDGSHLYINNDVYGLFFEHYDANKKYENVFDKGD